MPWAAAATVVGGYLTSKAAKSGAQAQTSANNAAIGEQQREFDQTQQNLAPYLGAGSNALNLQQQYLSGNTSGFDQSPDYQFAVQQGTKALDAGAASKGNREQAFHFDDAELRPLPGDIYTFDNARRHWVTNDSDEDRITLIVCVRR